MVTVITPKESKYAFYVTFAKALQDALQNKKIFTKIPRSKTPIIAYSPNLTIPNLQQPYRPTITRNSILQETARQHQMMNEIESDTLSETSSCYDWCPQKI